MTSKDLYGHHTPPPHPGEVLREDILPHYHLTRAELARHLKISTRLLGDVLRERRPITLDLALRLGAAFGQGPHFWLGLQAQFDLWHARRREPDVRPLSRITRRGGLKLFGAEHPAKKGKPLGNAIAAGGW